jgi:ribosomal protein L37E
MECSECGQTMTARAETCPGCGFPRSVLLWSRRPDRSPDGATRSTVEDDQEVRRGPKRAGRQGTSLQAD